MDEFDLMQRFGLGFEGRGEGLQIRPLGSEPRDRLVEAPEREEPDLRARTRAIPKQVSLKDPTARAAANSYLKRLHSAAKEGFGRPALNLFVPRDATSRVDPSEKMRAIQSVLDEVEGRLARGSLARGVGTAVYDEAMAYLSGLRDDAATDLARELPRRYPAMGAAFRERLEVNGRKNAEAFELEGKKLGGDSQRAVSASRKAWKAHVGGDALEAWLLNREAGTLDMARKSKDPKAASSLRAASSNIHEQTQRVRGGGAKKAPNPRIGQDFPLWLASGAELEGYKPVDRRVAKKGRYQRDRDLVPVERKLGRGGYQEDGADRVVRELQEKRPFDASDAKGGGRGLAVVMDELTGRGRERSGGSRLVVLDDKEVGDVEGWFWRLTDQKKGAGKVTPEDAKAIDWMKRFRGDMAAGGAKKTKALSKVAPVILRWIL